MRLLTCLGTIIRLERETGRLTHTRLTPVRDVAVDFVVALPPEGLAGPLEGPAGMLLLPGSVPGTIYLTRDGLFLGVGDAPFPAFSRGVPSAAEVLRLIPDDEVAALRMLLTHAWLREDTGEIVQPGEIAVAAGPVLRVAGQSFALGAERLGLDEGVVTLVLEGAPVRLRLVPGSLVDAAEIAVTAGDISRVPVVRDEPGLRAVEAARFVLPAPSETALPPILGSLADRAFLYCRGEAGAQPVAGRRQCHSDLVRERDKFVVLRGALAGTILDRAGISRRCADLNGVLPAYLRREGDAYFVDAAWLDAAPVLRGPHVVLGGGDGGILADMVRLSLIAPYLPPDAQLLVPAAGAYRDMLDAFGFGSMAVRDVAAEVCRVEELYWPARCSMAQMPASAWRGARERAVGRRPAQTGRPLRLYVRSAGARSVANAPLVEAILAKNRFKVITLEKLRLSERIDLYGQADIVVAPHGAALEHILFCQAGARVLELSPDCSYRPVVNDMAGKLGLTHAVLPCPTHDGTFDGRLNVPAARLVTLTDLLLSRQAI
jgi:hypothetical protein